MGTPDVMGTKNLDVVEFQDTYASFGGECKRREKMQPSSSRSSNLACEKMLGLKLPWRGYFRSNEANVIQ